MRRILRYFFQGLLVMVPVGLTVYIVAFTMVKLDVWVNGLLVRAGAEWCAPGVGVPVALGAVVLAGWLMDLWVFRKLWGLLDRTLEKLPFVKSIYSAIRDTMQFLFGEKQSFSKVVMVELPGMPHGVMGMVTNEEPAREVGPAAEGLLGVYVPMAFNLGGYTLYVPADKVRPVDMAVEDAMGFILSGGAARRQIEEE